jgi:hypothetical protein
MQRLGEGGGGGLAFSLDEIKWKKQCSFYQIKGNITVVKLVILIKDTNIKFS